jgi:hypothetical protein
VSLGELLCADVVGRGPKKVQWRENHCAKMFPVGVRCFDDSKSLAIRQ